MVFIATSLSFQHLRLVNKNNNNNNNNHHHHHRRKNKSHSYCAFLNFMFGLFGFESGRGMNSSLSKECICLYTFRVLLQYLGHCVLGLFCLHVWGSIRV